MTATSRPSDLRADPEEVAEWIESCDQLVAVGGPARAATVLQALAQRTTSGAC